MRRRLFALALPIVALVAVSTSGCMMFGTDCPSSYTLDFEERTVEEIGTELLADDRLDRSFAERVVRQGPLTETTIAGERIDNGTYVRANETYYLLTVTETDERRLDGYDFEIEYDSEVTPGDGAHTVAYADLPAADRRAFDYLHPDRDVSGARSFSGGNDYAYRNASAEASSVFLDRGTVWVEYEGSSYNVTVAVETAVPEYDYRYTATEVAANESAWLDYAVATHVRNLTLETGDQRDVVQTAIDGEYHNCTQTPTGDFGTVVDRLDAEEDGYIGGTEYVRYDGTYYHVELVHGVV